jgi:hypothetical protein
VCAAAAVGVDDDLAARDARVAVGTADDEFARRVDVEQVVVAYEVGQFVARPLQASLHARDEDAAHIVFDALAHLPFGLFLRHVVAGAHEFVVLGGNHDGVHPHRTARVVVFDRHLALGVGAEVGHLVVLAPQDGELFHDDLCENQRGGHVFARFVAGVTEHDALVAGALLVVALHHALVDVGALFVDGGENAAGVAVEHVVAPGVPDAVDYASCDVLYVHVRLRTYLARNDHQTCGTEGFAGHLRFGIAAEEFVEDRVGYLVRDFVGMPFRNGFRRK